MNDGETAGHAVGKSAIAVWASRLGIVGGCLSLLMGALVTVSVLGRWLVDQGIPGDFEFVQMGTAVSVFFFLPSCQAIRGNIIVDTFTGFLGERARNRLDALWDVVYGLVMLCLGYCMVLGTMEAISTGVSTMVLLIPTWPALALSTALVFFLAVVCFWTARKLVEAR
ncbi:MAG: TRAP transporter small permease [Proteobacteria bacterium]|nr:TRAP transporter small permease [Pseudomonadota bacterium]